MRDPSGSHESIAASVPEHKDAPCNICGRGWPYHHDSCTYKLIAKEKIALAGKLSDALDALDRIGAMSELPPQDLGTLPDAAAIARAAVEATK